MDYERAEGITKGKRFQTSASVSQRAVHGLLPSIAHYPLSDVLKSILWIGDNLCSSDNRNGCVLLVCLDEEFVVSLICYVDGDTFHLLSLSLRCWETETPLCLASSFNRLDVLRSVLNPRVVVLGLSFFLKSMFKYLFFSVVFRRGWVRWFNIGMLPFLQSCPYIKSRFYLFSRFLEIVPDLIQNWIDIQSRRIAFNWSDIWVE